MEFSDCISLTSLELGNLDTSSVTDMNKMFYNCQSLKSLNIYSFNTNKVDISLINDDLFFNICNLKYCINDNIIEVIKSKLSPFTKMDCSNLCYLNSQYKYILRQNKCINNCYNDIDNYYEYEHICYDSCPKGTHIIGINICEKDSLCDNYYNNGQTNCFDDIPLEGGYFYEINSNMTELKEIYNNVTFIYFSKENIDFIYYIFNLNKEIDKIYIIIYDQLPEDERTATSDYNYKFILENKTELNLSSIDKDFCLDFYVPITNLELVNYNYSVYFNNLGFDIYNKSSDFYNDF